MEKLTDKQLQALVYAGDGLTIREIGIRMGVSTSMASQHLIRVRKKLGVQHKRELIKAARQYFEAQA